MKTEWYRKTGHNRAKFNRVEFSRGGMGEKYELAIDGHKINHLLSVDISAPFDGSTIVTICLHADVGADILGLLNEETKSEI